jgi:hypothetical protein
MALGYLIAAFYGGLVVGFFTCAICGMGKDQEEITQQAIDEYIREQN